MGISLLILTLSGDWISLSLLYILLNLPLFLLGYRSFSLRFLVISLMGMGILSLNLEWTEGMNIPTRVGMFMPSVHSRFKLRIPMPIKEMTRNLREKLR